MREFKIIFWIIVCALIVIFIYQNQQFFFEANQSFRADLIFTEFKTPAISSALLLIIAVILGFIISYAFSIPGRMTNRKKIKLLQKAVDSQLKEIESLNKRLKASTPVESKPESENLEKTHSTYR